MCWLMGFVSVTELRSTQLIKEANSAASAYTFTHTGYLSILSLHFTGAQIINLLLAVTDTKSTASHY